jgi:outer membrane protein OmpA-like peptidoglycan-associated protein
LKFKLNPDFIMNRFLIPLLILLGSLLLSWHWNCNLKPQNKCGANIEAAPVVAPIVADTMAVEPDTTKLTQEEKLLIDDLDVYFAVNKAGISRSGEINTWLATAKAYLAQNPGQKLSVTGHTDSDGEDVANQALSESRAQTVKDILVKDGFSADNLSVAGKGESEPIAGNDTPENKAKNRRVSIRLIK